MWKFIKMLIGIGLLPLCWAVSTAIYALYQDSVSTAPTHPQEIWALPIGFAVWVAIYFILPRPVRTYVLAHELTHALWALMMGSRVGGMKVGKDGGHVELSRTNFLITLSPYFFPFYTVIVIAVYYLLSLSLDVEPYRIWWLAGVGLTWAFHVTFTISMLAEQQPDVQEHGRIFSYAVIYIANLLVIGLWMVLVGTPQAATFRDLLKDDTVAVYSYTWQYIQQGWEYTMVQVQHLRAGDA
ncbi:hypothetical protein EGM51_03420 [Verrucomicrobia bacterium S94]|nr:hypothetical protein EGM51_03420 [Verrucomicrobia bacterium S94]